MARRVILSDDFTGLESDDVKTIQFAVGDKFYEIDLGDSSNAKFVKAVKPFTDKAREITKLRYAATSTSGQSTDNEAEAIRAWARANGKEVAERGRIPQEIKDEYAKAMANANKSEDNSENGDGNDSGNSESPEANPE